MPRARPGRIIGRVRRSNWLVSAAHPPAYGTHDSGYTTVSAVSTASFIARAAVVTLVSMAAVAQFSPIGNSVPTDVLPADISVVAGASASFIGAARRGGDLWTASQPASNWLVAAEGTMVARTSTDSPVSSPITATGQGAMTMVGSLAVRVPFSSAGVGAANLVGLGLSSSQTNFSMAGTGTASPVGAAGAAAVASGTAAATGSIVGARTLHTAVSMAGTGAANYVGSTGASPDPSFVAATSGAGGGTNNPVVTKPTGVQDGDLIIIAMGANDVEDATGATLNGFTILGGNWVSASGGDGYGILLYKVASGEGASWTFTGLAPNFGVGGWGCVAYRNVDQASPIHTSSTTAPATSTTPVGTAIEPTIDNCMIVAAFCCDPTSGLTGTQGSSPAMTERVDQGDAALGYAYIEDALQTTAGSIQPSFTASVTDLFVVFYLALKKA